LRTDKRARKASTHHLPEQDKHHWNADPSRSATNVISVPKASAEALGIQIPAALRDFFTLTGNHAQGMIPGMGDADPPK
jgi:hypothetical protein